MQQRDAYQDFTAIHLPRAKFFDIDQVADQNSMLPHMLPTPAQFASAVESMEISNESHIVVYDANDFMASARVWWMFRVFGHHRIQVLDGGLRRWQQLDLPVTDQIQDVNPTSNFKPEMKSQLTCNLEQMRHHAAHNDVQIVDARSAGRFYGREPEPRPGLRSGHIPGSKNLFVKQLIDPVRHTLRPNAELETAFLQSGINLTAPIVTSCGTGVTAAILALALACLGREDIAVYDGSWTEWGGLSDTPIELE